MSLSKAPRAAVVLRDSTLREGLDTPGVVLGLSERVRIAEALAAARVPELEVVAPSRVREDLDVARAIRHAGLDARLTGLAYAAAADAAEQAAEAGEILDRLELLMPLSEARAPHGRDAKLERLVAVLGEVLASRAGRAAIGIGLPHATQCDRNGVVEIAAAAAAAGASRVTLYDTNGSADPFSVAELVSSVVQTVEVPVFFHAHDDLGLATANAFAAVTAGARGLDVTVNGLGDRAGNAPLEQAAVLLALRGFATSVDLAALRDLSMLVERLTGIAVSKLAPVVGELVFTHRSPAHLEALTEFEVLDPVQLGATRAVDRTSTRPVTP